MVVKKQFCREMSGWKRVGTRFSFSLSWGLIYENNSIHVVRMFLASVFVDLIEFMLIQLQIHRVWMRFQPCRRRSTCDTMINSQCSPLSINVVEFLHWLISDSSAQPSPKTMKVCIWIGVICFVFVFVCEWVLLFWCVRTIYIYIYKNKYCADLLLVGCRL